MRAAALPRRACCRGRALAVIAAAFVAPGCLAKRRAALPSVSGAVRLGPGARDEGPVVLPCGAVAADRTGLALEAQVSGEQIPKDHAEELGECFDAYAPGLFGYACALTQGDHALADDLVQSTFMAAARQWPTMRCLNDAQRLRWLHTTIGNLAISTFRRNEALGDRLLRLEAVFRPPPVCWSSPPPGPRWPACPTGNARRSCSATTRDCPRARSPPRWASAAAR